MEWMAQVGQRVEEEVRKHESHTNRNGSLGFHQKLMGIMRMLSHLLPLLLRMHHTRSRMS